MLRKRKRDRVEENRRNAAESSERPRRATRRGIAASSSDGEGLKTKPAAFFSSEDHVSLEKRALGTVVSVPRRTRPIDSPAASGRERDARSGHRRESIENSIGTEEARERGGEKEGERS